MFPTGEIFAIKKLFPSARLRGSGKRHETDNQKNESSTHACHLGLCGFVNGTVSDRAL